MNRFKTDPMQHQLACLRDFCPRKFFALNGEQGTGKTFIIINDAAQHWAAGEIDALLVFAPNGVHTNWTLDELPKHMPDWVRWRAAAWRSNPNKKQKQELEDVWCEDSTMLRILTMNWEALQTKKGMEFALRFARSSRSLMIAADESQYVMNPDASRTKALMKLQPLSKFRRTMSGTMSDGKPFNLFSQYNFLSDEILGTTSYFAFKNEYAEMMQREHPMVKNIMKKQGKNPERDRAPQIVARDETTGRPKWRNLDKLNKLIGPHTFRVLKKDCLDLPEKIYKTIYAEMTPQQKAHYKLMRDECRLILNDEQSAVNKLAALMKLAQITSGFYFHPHTSEPVIIEGDNPKLQLLVEHVKNAREEDARCIVWARFQHEIATIVAALKAEGLNVVEYHGNVGNEDRLAARRAIQDGSADVFVGQQRAGGTGITLTRASAVFYFSNTFSLIERQQSEDRAHRIGQERNVVYTDIVMEGTVDEIVLRTLRNKEEVADAMTDFARQI